MGLTSASPAKSSPDSSSALGSPWWAPVNARRRSNRTARGIRGVVRRRGGRRLSRFSARRRGPRWRLRLRGFDIRNRGERFSSSSHFANFCLLVFLAFCGEARFLAVEFLFASLQTEAIVLRFAQVGVEAIEEFANVASLRAEARSGCVDDRGIRPRRCAMLMPAEAPGTPTFSSRRWAGAWTR